MTRFLLPVVAVGALVLSVGCTTKNYVKQQTTPVINKIDELDERTAQTGRGIRELDQRAQQQIQTVDAKAGAADQKAVAARQQAEQAQQMASTAQQGATTLTARVANLDNYHAVGETTIHFGFNKAELTKKEREQLDELAGQISNVKGYIVAIEGRCDAVGNPQYNYELSQRRADAVTQYLASKYNVPPHKIFIVGLGKDAPVEENKTAKGRAENRRVDVRLMSNNLESQDTTASQPASQQPQTEPQNPPAAASPQQ